MSAEQLQKSHELALRRFKLYDYSGFDELTIPPIGQMWQSAQENIRNAKKNEGSKKFSDADLFEAMSRFRGIGYKIESAGRSEKKWDRLLEIANTIGAIVDFSAAGSYTLPKKKDSYAKLPYTRWADRYRADAAAKVGIIAAGVQTGHDFSAIAQDEVLTGFEPNFPDKRIIQEAIKASKLKFLYYGIPEEGAAIEYVLTQHNSYIPAESVKVSTDGITDTETQVIHLGKDLRFALENGILQPGQTIVMPSQAQALRIISMMEHYNTIPPGLSAAIFPIPAPTFGVEHYVPFETSKTIYSAITGHASLHAAKAEILGA